MEADVEAPVDFVGEGEVGHEAAAGVFGGVAAEPEEGGVGGEVFGAAGKVVAGGAVVVDFGAVAGVAVGLSRFIVFEEAAGGQAVADEWRDDVFALPDSHGAEDFAAELEPFSIEPVFDAEDAELLGRVARGDGGDNLVDLFEEEGVVGVIREGQRHGTSRFALRIVWSIASAERSLEKIAHWPRAARAGGIERVECEHWNLAGV